MNLTGFHELLASITDVELSALGERADVQSRDCPERDAAEVVSCAFRLVRLRQAFTLLYSEAHMTWLLRYEGIADALVCFVCVCVCVWMDGWMGGWMDAHASMHLHRFLLSESTRAIMYAYHTGTDTSETGPCTICQNSC